MSLSLDDKLLGEKTHYYCSSSEDEDEESSQQQPSQPAPPPSYQGTCVNTGPKGVIEDWRKFKQLETEQREASEQDKQELIKKLSLTCRSHLNEGEEKSEEDVLLEEIGDDFLLAYRRQRMEEMKNMFDALPKFGKVLNLTAHDFTTAVDKEKAQVTVIVHVYTKHSDACEAMNGCLTCLALEYPRVKFCKILASDARMSGHFMENGVPALLVYRNRELVGNFVRMSDEFGEDFFATDVESFLLEHGMLPSEEQMTAPSDVTSGHDSSDGFDVE